MMMVFQRLLFFFFPFAFFFAHTKHTYNWKIIINYAICIKYILY